MSACYPMVAIAGSFSASPAEFKVSDLSVGQKVERFLYVKNKEDYPQAFIISIQDAPDDNRRDGYEELPDNDWIEFDHESVIVDAHSSVPVTVYVDIPKSESWMGQKWEAWIQILCATSGMFKTVLNVRLLIDTDSELTAADTNLSTGERVALIVGGVGGVAILSAVGVWYIKKRRREQPAQQCN
ncbi:MAG: hypothetical protein SVY53_01195 [Chloroflexota bacterium]|nr:hypothetical protein [Chloroflexota bacterium]